MKWPTLFSRKQITPPERKAALGLNDTLGKFLLFGKQGGTTASGALELYNESTAVSVPVNYVADAFACIDPVIKQDGKIIRDHPVLDLLNKPSPFFTRELFFEMLGKEYLITGETGLVALGGIARPPLELQPITSKNFSPNEGRQGLAQSWILSGNTLPGVYELVVRSNRARYLDGTLREFKQIRSYSTRDGSLLRGQSLLRSASAEARQHILGNTHNVSILEKGGRVSLVFHFQEDMDQDDFETARDRVNERYGGADKAGTIGVTAGGKLDIKEVGTNNKDMDFALLQAMAKQAVAMTYKVPLPLVTTDASSFNNYKEAKLALFDDAVIPLASRILGGLTELLMPRYGEDPAKTRITFDPDQITALVSRRNSELKVRRELNLETTNEMRSTLGREAVTGGDSILVPANLIPMGTDLFTGDNISEPSVSLARDGGDE
jgi:HK97 family phage portal protein